MAEMAAKEAKTRFGELLDTAQREPVVIKKHGRDVAVVISAKDYKEIEALKLERLRARLAIGEAQAENGQLSDGEDFFNELLGDNG
ncbi:MAG: type II toxin-antitoxin system Phd/YefM family antitoxin [Halioglobus sp.]